MPAFSFVSLHQMASPLTEVADIQLQLTTHLSTPKKWKAELAWFIDLQRTVYPHKLSPVSYRSSAGQGKFAGQTPTCATQPTELYRGVTECDSSIHASPRRVSVSAASRPKTALWPSTDVWAYRSVVRLPFVFCRKGRVESSSRCWPYDFTTFLMSLPHCRDAGAVQTHRLLCRCATK